MRSLDEIIEELNSREDCVFRPATRLPDLPPGLTLPHDLALFYSRFSEARLSGRDDPSYHISAPSGFVNIGIAVCGEHTRHPVQDFWFALAHVQDGNYFAIDLHPSRLGRCYDIFHETYLPDECKIIALSFTELMNQIAAADDDCWWLDEKFLGYGYGAKLRYDQTHDKR